MVIFIILFLIPSYFVCFCLMIKPSPFTALWGGSVSVDFIFKLMLGSKEKRHHFFCSVKKSHSNIHYNQCKDL
jgi:hypothetical protein